MKQCSKCGYKFCKTINKKIIGIIALIVVLVVAVGVGIFITSSLSLSDEEKAAKVSIQELDITDQEITTCLLLDCDDGEYYIYFETTIDEYMTHIVDNTVESKSDRSEADVSGLIGSKAASEFTWSNYQGRDEWKNIDYDTLKKFTK